MSSKRESKPSADSTPSADSKASGKRRDALRKLAITGGVIGTARTWSKPVVDSVVLPAHALTSDPLRDPCSSVSIVPDYASNPLLNYFVRVSGFVEGSPSEISGIPIHIKVVATGGSGPETHTADTTTGSNGHYGHVDVGPFNACSGATDTVTISSTAFAGTATCTVVNGKKCV